MTPRAAPHPHVGTGAQGTAQAAGGCPHHLCQDREQTLLVSIHPDITQLIAPGCQYRALSHQGIASQLPRSLWLDDVPSQAVLCNQRVTFCSPSPT